MPLSVFILWYKVIQCLSMCLWEKNVVLMNYYRVVGCFFFKQSNKNEWYCRKALTSPVIFHLCLCCYSSKWCNWKKNLYHLYSFHLNFCYGDVLPGYLCFYIGLLHEQNMAKMRLLTFMGMAVENKEISFDTMQQELQIGADDVEAFVIDGKNCNKALYTMLMNHTFYSLQGWC